MDEKKIEADGRAVLQESTGGDEIKDTDIVFECPYCQKSLAIDYRGAGLSIPCSDCGKMVDVPIPEGMELMDIDSTEEEQEVRIINLRKALVDARGRIAELEAEIEDLNAKARTIERKRRDDMFRFGQIQEQADIIEGSLEAVRAALTKILKVARKEPAEDGE